MRWTLLLLRLLNVLHQSQAETFQERVPLFRLTQQGPWESDGSNATGSPCEGLAAIGATVLTLVNHSLERLPGCLPRSLHSLDGSHNLLRALSLPELRHLPRLQVLTLRHNRISAVRWGPGGPVGLHTLDLSYNQLAALPPCAGSALSNLRVLILAGNPLQALQPRAFACFPALQLLNLSASALGLRAQGGIADAAFAGADGKPLAKLEALDLSSTYLQRVEPGWIRDLPNLMSLYLRKMPRLRILEGDIFKMTPNLRHLDCRASPALTSVHTHIFENTPCLQVLLFQNCNLSVFPPWSMNSSQVLSINLFGNPLTCSCELSWLLVDAKRTVLSRAEDTMCIPAAGSGGPFSVPLPLSQLPDLCRSDHRTTVLASDPPPLDHSAYAPSIQAPSTQPVEQSVTNTPSHTVVSLSPAAWTRGDAGELTAHSIINPTAGYRNFSVLPKAASTAGTNHGGKHTTSLVLEPNVSAASTSLASKHHGPFPTSRNPMRTSQPDQKTQATPQVPQPSPSEGGIPVLLLDDYGEEEGTREEVRAPDQYVPCDYHPCKHLQTPCAELQRYSGCSCPGLSQEDTIPDSPRLQGVSEMTDTSALILWCAPNSVVHGYQIRYSAEGKAENQSVVENIYATARQHPLYGLLPGTTYRVCVLAANRAGLSLPRASGWRRACTNFTTKPSYLAIFTGLCATSSLLLISTLVLSVCLCRRGWMSHRQCYDTHLVAFKNPAIAERVAQW